MKSGVDPKFDKFIKDLEKGLTEIIDKRQLHKMGTRVKDAIKERMREGFSVDAQGNMKPYKPLAQKTIDKRRKNAQLSSLTSPQTSNQIETGKMYDSIRTYSSTGEVFIGIAESNDRSEVAEYQDEARPTFNLSKEEQDLVQEIMEELAEKILKKIF